MASVSQATSVSSLACDTESIGIASFLTRLELINSNPKFVQVEQLGKDPIVLGNPFLFMYFGTLTYTCTCSIEKYEYSHSHKTENRSETTLFDQTSSSGVYSLIVRVKKHMKIQSQSRSCPEISTSRRRPGLNDIFGDYGKILRFTQSFSADTSVLKQEMPVIEERSHWRTFNELHSRIRLLGQWTPTLSSMQAL